MELLPEIETISNLKNNQDVVLAKVKERPVLLLQHSKPLVVMTTPEQWDQIARDIQFLTKRIRHLELVIESKRISAEMDTDPTKVVKLADLEKRLLGHAGS